MSLRKYYQTQLGAFPYTIKLVFQANYDGTNIYPSGIISRPIIGPQLRIDFTINYTPAGGSPTTISGTLYINSNTTVGTVALPIPGSPATITIGHFGITSYSITSFAGNPVQDITPY